MHIAGLEPIHQHFSEAFASYCEAVVGSERSRHTYSRRLETVEELCGGLTGKRVLDIGCAYGFRTVGLLERGAAFVAGIDLDQNRIAEAKQYAHQMGMTTIAFQAMNAESLEYEDNSFDVVLADEMIHHADNLSSVLGEMFRVTKRGGVTVISDHNKWSLASELVRCIYFGKNRARVFSARQVSELLKTAQFQDIKYRHVIFTLPFRKTPRFLVRINSVLEALIESIPVLRIQCAVYVIRGVK
jgi:2-polyprenyl-3-methyl-5-hydroxy-6-metoxy-1,4-benzoquinol methylase